ncbi:50S ribosomal protein L17 [Candidatus Phytoplasma australiense]|uniref:Large ribosomal subunit protein bL17 n=2 Tax=Phytoplasma australiense TaxID=59748 RepID=RL17_PHYAS|nr:50S ribosomal protein L17 [Candidatus Phytoplasma australiense]B1VAC0.1 RecName: Full=Large ribosomal subunit protein bL17; AltName: Full=50S ribosomal protein L17 [Candidatus Phytoplasma australiense]AGL90280.1 50S ribosomal protein L17 [Strawberry lethal yellows phytoplasma (CPA) str. NZSb11]CAM11893.1 50S ribosomal protein L17 [Candidatus Phytoplasma australiense]
MPFSKLGRNKSQRRALLRTLMTDLIVNEQIITTESKAKELQRLADKMITLAKKGTLHTRRQAARHLFDEKINEETTVLQKLFQKLASQYLNCQGGYTRVIKTVPRRGDAAPMAIIAFA